MKLIRYPNTKLTEDHDAVQTTLTLDFTGLTPEDILEIAAQAATIKWQGNARRMKEVPVVATYTVPKPGTRGTVDPVQALIARYGSAEKAIEFLKSTLPKPEPVAVPEDFDTSDYTDESK